MEFPHYPFQKPIHVPAHQYIEFLFEWIADQLHDESIFPTDTRVEFPKDFKKNCKKILSRMYRVFVHVYIHHFDRITELSQFQAEGHSNTLFKYFYFFVKEHNLLEDKEMEPLKDLIEKLCLN